MCAGGLLDRPACIWHSPWPSMSFRPAVPTVLTKRRGVIAAAGVLALAGAFCDGPTATDARELALLVANASGSVVRPEDLRWEPSRGVITDFARGRFLLFLGSEREGAP